MKNTFLTILMLMGAVFGAVAQNTLSVSSAEGVPGDVVNIDISLRNSDEVTAAEFVIPLAEKQLVYVDGSCVINGERADGHQLSAAVVDGTLRIYIYSITLAPLKGNEGNIASFSLKLGKSPAGYPLLPQVVLSDAGGKALAATASAGTVTILAPQVEIVTQSIDFGHVPIMSSYTKSFTLRNSGTLPLEVSDIGFSASEFSTVERNFTVAAGATKSITVEYSPVVRGAIEKNITIVSNAVNGNVAGKLVADPYSVNELHSNRVEGVSGEEVTVELRMNNMEPIVGMQTTFTLPAGIEYVEGSFAPTERASSHIAVATVSGNSLTLFLYSSSNTVITGNDGVVATFRLYIDCKSGYYNIAPQNTVLSNATLENMVSAVSGNYIVVKSPNISGNSSLDMGNISVTETAKADYTIRNSGNAMLVINGVAFLANGYRITNELPVSIKANSTAVLNVEYVPTVEGEHSTTMNIYSNDPDEKLKTVKVSGSVYEPNNLTFEGENLQNGDYMMSIGLENYTGIVAMQMDIHFMAGMSTSNELLQVTQRLASHTCSVTKIDENTWRFIAFSLSNASVAGNVGKLFDLTFSPGNGVEYKDVPIIIDNVILSSSSANNYTSQLTLNAVAEFKNFYVRFICDGNIVSESFQKVGTVIEQPQMEEWVGYTFSGWGNVPAVMPAEDVTFNSSYTINEYTITYIVNGEVYDVVTLPYGSEVTPPDAPEIAGYKFIAWDMLPETVPANDVEVVAIYEDVPTEIVITINQYGSATYCSKYTLDFSNVDGLKAYTAAGYKANSQIVILMRVHSAVAGTGLFLKGEPGEYVVPVIEDTDEHYLNMLVGTLEQVSVNSTSDDGVYANFKYTIKSSDETPLFYRFDDGSTMGTGKAYLQIPIAWLPSTVAKSVSIRFDDGETTCIEEMEEQGTDNKEIYDLQGRKLNDISGKGVYIINGKKVIK